MDQEPLQQLIPLVLLREQRRSPSAIPLRPATSITPLTDPGCHLLSTHHPLHPLSGRSQLNVCPRGHHAPRSNLRPANHLKNPTTPVQNDQKSHPSMARVLSQQVRNYPPCTNLIKPFKPKRPSGTWLITIRNPDHAKEQYQNLRGHHQPPPNSPGTKVPEQIEHTQLPPHTILTSLLKRRLTTNGTPPSHHPGHPHLSMGIGNLVDRGRHILQNLNPRYNNITTAITGLLQ